MAVRTTQFDLRGDRYQAEQLVRAHADRLLNEFRNLNAFQGLQTNSRRVFFQDNFGKTFGSMTMQTVFGTETVVVDVPILSKKVKKEEPQGEPPIRIVPCIRDKDNKYWIACLSGTFEPPYQLFKNIFDIPAEEMADNVEHLMDKKLISTGASLTGEGIAQLYFVAQTGLRPDDISWTTPGDVPQHSYAPVGGLEGYLCQTHTVEDMCSSGIDVAIYKSVYWQQFETTYSDAYDYTFLCDGVQLSGDMDTGYSSTGFARGWSTATAIGNDTYNNYFTATGFYSCPAPDDFRDDTYPDYLRFVDNYVDMYPQQPETPEPGEAPGGWMNSSANTLNYETVPIAGIYSVRLENANEFCAVVSRSETRDITIGSNNGYSPCDQLGGRDSTYSTTTTRAYTYSIVLDGESHVIFTSDSYPPYHAAWSDDNQVKYYGATSPAAVTGLACTVLRDDGQYAEFNYHYIGPNNDDALITTIFATTDGDWEHTIEVGGEAFKDEDGNDLIFYGEIFLGLLQEI